VKNRQPVILLIVFLFSAGIALFPSHGFTQDTATIEGMIEIERNHLYMIAVGSDRGLAKGDIVDIYRLDVKIAEARLISVLSDSSMAEMIKLINVHSVFESDTVQYTVKLKVEPKLKATLSSQQKPDDDEPDISVIAREREKRGLLGSDTSIERQVRLARLPLEKEVEGLKAGMDILQEDYEGKMDAVLSTVAGSKARAVVALEKKWRKKYNVSTEQYEERLSEQRKALEAEYANEKEGLKKRIQALTRQINQAGESGDKRTKQLMKDLKSTDDTVNMLRETFGKERTLEEGRWTEKIEELERKYQKQLYRDGFFRSQSYLQ